ncbi:cell division ATP-binding protein FtsE [Brevundimonas denitrificans]|uniref:Cell division ATP-binding protein FtsE n=1 Tax=Brevundimonas denitrificans TaxID=1443434 RepID=A0ABQ6BRJ3_9CAUL|nr:ATP-binding cassette domain-containing protein [Brevundimonas denitrificans]GLS02424.1 cell division ATP-binding protein FtsE [Brevundimonas denitrificans]
MPVQPRRAYESDAVTETVRLSGVGFGYAATHRALRDVNLTLPAGSFHFLTGASGAGKSTLLKLLTLAEHPLTGTLHLFGEDATTAPRRALPAFRRRMGVVFQDFRLLDHLSAFDNVALPLRLTGGRQADYAGDVEEMLDWVGLGDRMDDRPPSFSGGEKQRLAIARAVVTRPELILADEPTGSVDAAMGERLLKLFQSLNRLGTTVLIASHDQALAERSGATVLRLEGGRLTGGAT